MACSETALLFTLLEANLVTTNKTTRHRNSEEQNMISHLRKSLKNLIFVFDYKHRVCSVSCYFMDRKHIDLKQTQGKAVPQHTYEVSVGRVCIAPTHS
jgi:hypothetical protein